MINVYDLNGNKMGFIYASTREHGKNILNALGYDWYLEPRYL